MTTDLEKQFFDTFGIEPFIYCSKPILDCDARKSVTCTKDCEYYSGVLYPQITDRILLELICILTKRFDYADQNWLTKCDNAEALKVAVLRLLLLCTSEQIEIYKHQVQALFEEQQDDR